VSLVNTVIPWLYKLTYDPINSFTPIAIFASAPNVLLVHPDVPAKSVSEFVALAKAKPGELQYASGGVGSFQHLGGELFKLSAGVDMLHVPFKGGGPAMIDVLGGHSKVVFATTITALPHVRSGRLRALGVGSRARSPVMADVPTIAEAGVPGYEAVNWIGMVAPAGTPAAIVARLHDEVTAALDSPELQKHFAAEGLDIMRMSTPEFGTFMAAEMAKWERVVKEGGIKAE
jgi:tripartite-type tricarboxylate transporter receptor subunit TctC